MEVQNEKTKARLIWDCGSTLYDSFELKSFNKQLESAIASRTLSMPHLVSRRAPPPPAAEAKPEPPAEKRASKFSRSLNKFLRSFLKSWRNTASTGPISNVRGQTKGGFYVIYDKSGALSTIQKVPETVSEYTEVAPAYNYLVRRSASERFRAASIEFAKRLIILNQSNFIFTFLIPNTGSALEAQNKALESTPKSINAVFLPPVSLDDISEETPLEARIGLTLSRSIPSLRDSRKVLLKLKSSVEALVVDLFGVEALDVAREFGVLPYIFFPCSSLFLSFLFHLPSLSQAPSFECMNLDEEVQLPGCEPVQKRDLVAPDQDKTDEGFGMIIQISRRIPMASGIMVNSFFELEKGSFKAFKEDGSRFPLVYPVGPLIQTGSTEMSNSECLKWLDHQPRCSVLFVSFGSGGTLSEEQLTELAFGLEMSGQRFLWVTGSPNNEASHATFFTLQSSKDPFDFLPKGFTERTKNIGLVVPSWAPQLQVLSHCSTGGFLTHCGWNSILESIVHGVPLIAWPLFGDQRMNATMVSVGLKVGIRMKKNGSGVVERAEIANHVKSLMVGEEGKMMRERMVEL
ncbi:UDP-glucuronosyl/UDP-glucosyltransferase [Dillenia turbinata]|uniref:Glycosyltransferase n=1 Tax=Dillenia turbinata TaxID=194707 RepID=A0AAN8VWM2_9MAGN